jgi:trehalose synthase
MIDTWRHYNELTAAALADDYDFVVVHDPQPAGVPCFLREKNAKSAATRWIWRCHIDLTRANPEVWDFLREYLTVYDASIFTMQGYVEPDVPIPMVALIAPAIDPLSPKNEPLAPDRARAILRRYGVDPDRPLIAQISRFDPWKDPLGVIDVYRQVKPDFPNLQLALVGSMATDDPEGWHYYELSLRYAGMDTDIHVLTNFQGVGNVEVNAFQRESDVALQKSLREGFALTVSEALWKGRPVVATDVGGIPLQIASGRTGYLVHSTAQAAERVAELLARPHLADEFGRAGRERVRENFLTTRLLMDYLQLLNQLRLSTGASGKESESRLQVGGSMWSRS